MARQIQRMGRFVDADEVFEAWTSGDLRRMLAATSRATNPVDRHFLLQGIVQATYKLRSDPEMRRLCINTGKTHLSEFGEIGPALRADMDGTLPRVPSFACVATALAEEGRVDEGAMMCERAAALGLDDGTRAGYLGRAERLRARKSQATRDT